MCTLRLEGRRESKDVATIVTRNCQIQFFKNRLIPIYVYLSNYQSQFKLCLAITPCSQESLKQASKYWLHATYSLESLVLSLLKMRI